MGFITVFGSKKKNKDDDRYYLLPGMGKANRRKHAAWFRWALIVGVIVSILFGILLYFMNRPFKGLG